MFNWDVMPLKKSSSTTNNVSKVEKKSFLTMVRLELNFVTEVKETQEIHTMVVRVLTSKPNTTTTTIVSNKVQALLREFSELVSENLSYELPPMRDIQHYIDLIPRTSFLNLPHYWMSSKENDLLQEKNGRVTTQGFYSREYEPICCNSVVDAEER